MDPYVLLTYMLCAVNLMAAGVAGLFGSAVLAMSSAGSKAPPTTSFRLLAVCSFALFSVPFLCGSVPLMVTDQILALSISGIPMMLWLCFVSFLVIQSKLKN